MNVNNFAIKSCRETNKGEVTGLNLDFAWILYKNIKLPLRLFLSKLCIDTRFARYPNGRKTNMQ